MFPKTSKTIGNVPEVNFNRLFLKLNRFICNYSANCFSLLIVACLLGPLHTMADGREAVDFHQLDCKKPRIRPLDPSH
jgi:hypothetical protein